MVVAGNAFCCLALCSWSFAVIEDCWGLLRLAAVLSAISLEVFVTAIDILRHEWSDVLPGKCSLFVLPTVLGGEKTVILSEQKLWISPAFSALPPVPYFLVCQSNSIQELNVFFQRKSMKQSCFCCHCLCLSLCIFCHLAHVRIPAGFIFVVYLYCLRQNW